MTLPVNNPLKLNATLGVMGGGQLGRMFVQTAQRMGFRVAVLEPDAQSPAGLIAHHHIKAAYTDVAGLAYLAASADAITTEFENVPAQSLASLAQTKPVHPSAAAVAVCQDRALEKAYFKQSGVACAPYAEIKTAADCATVSADLFPAILKTAQMGYDGKGQAVVKTAAELPAAFAAMGGARCVLEKKLSLAYEISVIVARGADGAVVNLPVQQNLHQGGILALTQVPAPDVAPATCAAAIVAAEKIAAQMNYVGVLCVEFFVLESGELLANELAPRPHNSGHYSLDACDINQYELQVRTLAQLPLTQPALLRPAVMLNLLGDSWYDGEALREPNFAAILKIAGAKLHLYDKTLPKRGRKMGYITVVAPTLQEAKTRAESVAQILDLVI